MTQSGFLLCIAPASDLQMKLVMTLAIILVCVQTSLSCAAECTCHGTDDSSVICSVQDIAHIPTTLSPRTKLLTIIGNREQRFSLQRLSRADFRNLKQLIHLKISFTQLTIVDEDAFFDLVSVKRIELDHNDLSLLQPNTFSNLRNLTFLALSNNPGLALSDRIFWNIPKLQELYLSGLDLSEAKPIMFYGLGALKKLDLSSNQLTDFSPDILVSMHNLWSLDLAFNHLRSLDSKLEPFFAKLRRVRLGGNRWQCNCMLKWLQGYPTFIASPLSDAVVCAAPAALQFHYLIDVEDTLLMCHPPVISSCPGQVTVLEGQTLSVACQVKGEPFPKVTWTFADGTQLMSNTETDPAMSSHNESIIRVPRVSSSLHGILTVSASNDIGSDSGEIEVIVNKEPTTTTLPAPTTTPTTPASTAASSTIVRPATLDFSATVSRTNQAMSSTLPPLSGQTGPASGHPVMMTDPLTTVSTPAPNVSSVVDNNTIIIAAAGTAGFTAVVVAAAIVVKVIQKLSAARAAVKVAPHKPSSQ